MDTVFLFALLGLGTGALIAMIAVGVVLSWRGSGTINIAAGAVVMVAGYLFWSLRTGFFAPALTTPAAIVVTLLAMALLAVMVEFAAVKPLRSASPLAKLVASIGVLLLLQAVVQLVFGTAPLNSPAVLTDSVVEVGGVTVPVAQLILAAVVVLISTALAALYRFTRFGIATRAASESERSAVLAGLSPSSISLANSVLAYVTAGFVGILAASIVGVSASTLPLLVIPALAAALFAGFSSIGIACAAGLLIGMAESLLSYASTMAWFPTQDGITPPGLQQLAEFLLIVIALWWKGSTLPQRGEFVGRSLPAVPRQEHLLRRVGPVFVVGAIALLVLPADLRQAITTGLVATVLCLSFIVIMGYVGQLSVVQLALAGFAAFAVSRLGTEFGLGFPAAPIIAVLAATALGVGIGAAALRVRGVTLVVVTLAAAVAIEQFVFANSEWGGGQTGAPVASPTLFGFNFGPDSGLRGLDGALPSPVFGLVALVVATLAYMGVVYLRNSDLGRQMLAIRSNERAAAAAGVNVRTVKIVAFGITSALAGVAGVMYAYQFGTVSANSYGISVALTLVASVYVLGVTLPQGAVLAGFGAIGSVIPLILQKYVLPADHISLYVQLLIGGGLLLQLRFFPDGLLVSRSIKKERKTTGIDTLVPELPRMKSVRT
ncbi:branched-chain amino acid ABC transporter permease [Rhodococcus sp. 15-2388-1-1a]|uniref:branched-chain amino acid ABC transporter permease n=2 Tax=Mycobacteriales TaxID=85007 RepID=UPI00068C54DC|nr:MULTISPECIES: ABC transporter permease [Rhodococcus]KAA0923562.1 ABC transporter permease [Rhodococcus sp. ANT_H53B]OZF04353.1 branched-chain amino acid ABC transporter permease [Rhodococcus sp. 15-2388-1-1a]OZF37249.1 branched-chain amino acid ABC transporter permease [Rhodococcus sp. 14-2483-1-2]